MSNTVDSTTNNSYHEDWDKSLISEDDSPSQPSDNASQPQRNASTPRNSVIFPAVAGDSDTTSGGGMSERNRYASGQGKRTLSELLKLHAEKGTDCRMSPEEAARLGDVLGQWINASSSPYEGEDDFFKSHDDIRLLPKRGLNNGGRPRGQSECTGSRPPSSAGFAA
ncbi:hypothetical protein P691DRAFT_677223 [Macrolepiota fuliginosa MF-IS2]|uniref:Uncharacterized protein n=1 Tax=Macrolepiota fuliginosa MF-IS2 TaxID=1400762 RepID=A0A9P5X775_9AGAR|nr:hypothetical protein P691DRAFT_677223 [Macrolepiota fuliginosa MF-IS2]